jgi:hypothetical protein
MKFDSMYLNKIQKIISNKIKIKINSIQFELNLSYMQSCDLNQMIIISNA